MSKHFVRDDQGTLTGVVTVDVNDKLEEIPGSERTWEADLVLLSMGFLQPEHYINDGLGLDIDERGTSKPTRPITKRRWLECMLLQTVDVVRTSWYEPSTRVEKLLERLIET